MVKFKSILIFVTLLVCVSSWKSCYETFCDRIRKSPEGFDQYSLTLNVTEWGAEGILTAPNSTPKTFMLVALTQAIFYMRIQHTDQNNHLELDPKQRKQPLTILERTNSRTTLASGSSKAIIYNSPFKVEFYNSDTLVSIANAQNRLVYETTTFNTAIALDVSFPGSQRAYGIPLHADNLALRNTGPGSDDPYRLFNVDYGRYKVKSTESLYGAVPVLYAHGTNHSSGVYWRNPSQTWIDITTGPNQVDAFFMSEAGHISMFILTGPTLAEAVQQNIEVTGAPLMQQYFTLGYHQSRYSYMTENDVRTVVEEFDKADLPLDVVWLDIDYTENKKYFTWDPIRFKNPIQLQEDLAATNRKLVAIIDPHIKVEKGYFLHDNATANGYYVRNPDGSDYMGKCWPGDSSYLDFFNPDAMTYYANLYSTDTFKSKNVHVWNDMNEPAIFENWDHENTMAGDLLHYGDLQHKEVHNIYGLYQVMASYRGLIDRKDNQRPFILTRSHFGSVQQFAAIWTGDNYASWDYLEISFPMCLSEALAGVSFCGADVGGFAGIPDDELYQRWYQAGAWLPFYRGHSAIDVPRREPYLYSDGIKSRVRTALNQRYAHLPAWYTVFWEYHTYGDPVIRPITYHYPKEEDALSIDNQILLGANILAAPILKQGAFLTPIYLPGGESEIWYNIDDNYKTYAGTGYHYLFVNLDSVPVFYRGGSIIPRKDTPRPSTVDTHKDPYTIYVCLDKNNRANGTLYVDDYESFDYPTKHLYVAFSYSNNTFSTVKIDLDADYDGAAEIGEIKILRPPSNVAGARIVGQASNERNLMKMSYSDDGRVLTISNIGASLRTAFDIELFMSKS